jgi:hypothetical protein
MLTELSIKKQPLPDKRRELPDSKITGLYLVPKQIFDRRELGLGYMSRVIKRSAAKAVKSGPSRESQRASPLPRFIGSSPSRLRSLLRGPQWVHEIKRLSHGRAHLPWPGATSLSDGARLDRQISKLHRGAREPERVKALISTANSTRRRRRIAEPREHPGCDRQRARARLVYNARNVCACVGGPITDVS